MATRRGQDDPELDARMAAHHELPLEERQRRAEAANAKTELRRSTMTVDLWDDDAYEAYLASGGDNGVVPGPQADELAPAKLRGGDVNGANQYGSYDNSPSDKQVAYLTSLLDGTAEATGLTTASVIDGMKANNLWTKRSVSNAIDALKKSGAAAGATSSKSVRSNRYPGKCRTCGGQVAEGAGRIEKLGEKWATFHLDGECVEANPEAIITGSLEGMHRTPDGGIYKVQVAVHGSGHEYAKKLTDGAGTKSGYGFEYAPGAIKLLSDATRMSLEEAKEFGRLYGVCCVCAATLTDEGSIAAGIGPICSGKVG